MGCAVGFEVFFAAAGDGGVCAGKVGGGVSEVCEESEVLGFVAEVVVGFGLVVGVEVGLVFVEVCHV